MSHGKQNYLKIVDIHTFSKIKWKSVKTKNEEHKKLHLFHCEISTWSKFITIINNSVKHKNWVDTCDVRIQLYLECTNSTLPSIELESICDSLRLNIIKCKIFEIRNKNIFQGWFVIKKLRMLEDLCFFMKMVARPISSTEVTGFQSSIFFQRYQKMCKLIFYNKNFHFSRSHINF